MSWTDVPRHGPPAGFRREHRDAAAVGSKARITEFFLLPADETAIVDAIRAAFPEVAFIDDSPWPSVNEPPLRDSLLDCGWIVGIWNRAARPRIVGAVRSNGRVVTPYSDYVVEWQRSLERAPGTLEHEFGLNGPEMSHTAAKTVAFAGKGIRYRIMLDPLEMRVLTDVEVGLETGDLVAPVGDLAQAVGLAARNAVNHTAHSLRGLRHALQVQAGFIRALQPRLGPEGRVELMRAAHAREWRIR